VYSWGGTVDSGSNFRPGLNILRVLCCASMPDSRQLRRGLRRLIPRPVRQRLYDWGPSRTRRWHETPGLQSLSSEENVAILTFDDGPDPEGTPRVLDALDQAEVSATFFVLGRHVGENPELIREMVAQGHEVGLHGMEHRRHDQLLADAAEDELAAGMDAIAAATGQPPIWYRPPFGASSPTLGEACEKLGLRLVYWSAWGQDWEESSPGRIAGLVERGLSSGAIVLLHDSARYGQRASAVATAESIPLISSSAKERGLRLVSLGASVSNASG
jgi:peptidoglycan/xylan/chitin deacetylase (PgdA/CDA1 family)